MPLANEVLVRQQFKLHRGHTVWASNWKDKGRFLE